MLTYTFPSTISAREIQRGYKKVFARVKKTKRPVVVMTNNAPQAAIISLEMLDKYNELQREQAAFTMIDAIRKKNRDKNPDEVYKEITEITEQVRQELYDKAQSND